MEGGKVNENLHEKNEYQCIEIEKTCMPGFCLVFIFKCMAAFNSIQDVAILYSLSSLPLLPPDQLLPRRTQPLGLAGKYDPE